MVDDVADSVHRLDGQSGDVAGSIQLAEGTFPRALAFGTDAQNVDSLWVANAGTSTITRIDPHAGTITAGAIPLRYVPEAISAGTNDIWVASNASDVVLRLDPVSNAVTATIEVCDQPTAIAADGDGAWVACGGSREVWHLGHDGETLSQTDVGGVPTDIAITPGGVFVTVRR